MSVCAVSGTNVRSALLSLALLLVPPGAGAQTPVFTQSPAFTQSSPFTQSLAASASAEPAVADWYRTTGYRTLWTGPQDAARRAALLAALATADLHGLPRARYDAGAIRAALAAAATEGDRGRIEVEMTRAYLAWAADLTAGALVPKAVDGGILREILRPDPQVLLSRIATGKPEAVLAGLVPDSPVYVQLMKAKLDLEAVIAAGGWGEPLAALPLEPGATGPAVVALRDRLVRLGYLRATASARYDAGLQAAVQRVQLDNGLVADGRLGEGTIAELNRTPEERLQSVVVALERERWMHVDRNVRHVWVNLPDFKARIVDQGRTIFETRVVIGKNLPDLRSPEFSDEMEHMVINPSWGVPRSIIVKEYLPLLQKNPNAVGHLQVVDRRGRVVPRGSVNFGAYTARSFPYALRQPPSDDNALGKVKFMFPNPYNIYLHDTPSKSLFDKEVRAYSHGCIRVADPFDLAHELLSWQTDDAEGEFETALKTGRETTVKLNRHLPVHLVYFTAYPDAKGRMAWRRDVYGRDAALWEALSAAGVELPGVRG